MENKWILVLKYQCLHCIPSMGNNNVQILAALSSKLWLLLPYIFNWNIFTIYHTQNWVVTFVSMHLKEIQGRKRYFQFTEMFHVALFVEWFTRQCTNIQKSHCFVVCFFLTKKCPKKECTPLGHSAKPKRQENKRWNKTWVCTAFLFILINVK